MTPITAGDTLDFSVAVAGRTAADGWTLHYRLVSTVVSDPPGTPIEFDSIPAADGERHRLLAAAADTADWPPGLYAWSSWVDNADLERFTVDTGNVSILINPALATEAQDFSTQAERALAAAEAALAAWTPTMRSYTIGGRSMTFALSADILPIISYWKIAVQREQRSKKLSQGLADPRKLQVRLGRG